MPIFGEVYAKIPSRKILPLCTQRQLWRKILPLGIKAGFSLASHTLRKRRKGLVPYGRRFCSVGMQLLLLRVELKGGAQRETGDKHSTVFFHTQRGGM